MIIEHGMYINAFITIALIDGTSGQMGISIEFDNEDKKFSDVDSNKIKEICKFPTEKDESAPSGFYWTYYIDDSGKFILSYTFMFETLERTGVTQKFQLLNSVYAIVRDLNTSDIRMGKECPPDRIETKKLDE